jgi:omega-3 fatty acid desaturase (delta-15 desaturase)
MTANGCHSVCPSQQKSAAQNGDSATRRSAAKKPAAGVAALKTSAHVQQVESDADVHDSNFSHEALRRALPKEVFVKSLRRSLQWMVFDMAVMFLGLWATKQVYFWDASDSWGNSGLRLGALLLLTVATGFYQWCVFVVGHDCGHQSFSTFRNVNFLCGLITHGSILVPFSPWQRSHRFHHMYHNHLEKDYSYPWLHEPSKDPPVFHLIMIDTIPMKLYRAFVFPFFAYAYYLAAPEFLFGLRAGVDGNHFVPFESVSGRLWKDASRRDKVECLVSNASIGMWLFFFIHVFYDGSPLLFARLFLPTWSVFIFCLFAVTFLQHHDEDTKVYDDSTWSYATAAFETVDRDYGAFVNLLHHHISDCHVVHHLFFTKIPHYNLRKATDAMVVYLAENNLSHLYKTEKAYAWPVQLMKYMWYGMIRVVLVTKDSGKYL